MHAPTVFETVMEADAHIIGHGAVIHGCRIGCDALVGMNAVVMGRAIVGEQAVVAALSFVKIGGRVPPRMLVAGVPAKLVRKLFEAEVRGNRSGTLLYQELAVRSGATMVQVDTLTAMEPGRARSGRTRAQARFGI